MKRYPNQTIRPISQTSKNHFSSIFANTPTIKHFVKTRTTISRSKTIYPTKLQNSLFLSFATSLSSSSSSSRRPHIRFIARVKSSLSRRSRAAHIHIIINATRRRLWRIEKIESSSARQNLHGRGARVCVCTYKLGYMHEMDMPRWGVSSAYGCH